MTIEDYALEFGMTVAGETALDAASRFTAEFWNRLPDRGFLKVVHTGVRLANGRGRWNTTPDRWYYRITAHAELPRWMIDKDTPRYPKKAPRDITFFDIEEVRAY